MVDALPGQYTHIGIEDQAKALQFLPSTNEKSGDRSERSLNGQQLNVSEGPEETIDDRQEQESALNDDASLSASDEESSELDIDDCEGPNTKVRFDSRRLHYKRTREKSRVLFCWFQTFSPRSCWLTNAELPSLPANDSWRR